MGLKRNSKQAVADACGVNLTTVTLALNNHPRVAERTRQRIQAEARRLGYVPNHAARQLIRQRYQPQRQAIERVGFVLFSGQEPLRGPYMAFLVGVEQEISRNSGTLLFIRENRDQPRARFVELSRSGAVDGLVLVGTVDDKALLNAKRTHLPFVVVGDYQGIPPIHQATADFSAVGQLAVRHLVDQGHRRIGFIGATMKYVYQREIRDGVKAALTGKGLPASAEFIQSHGINEDLMTPLRHLLSMRPRPTALILGEPKEAIHLLALLKECQLKVPDDISLVACEESDSHPVAEGINHVDVSMAEVGMGGVELLRAVTADPGGPVRKVLIAPRLVEGGSVKRLIE